MDVRMKARRDLSPERAKVPMQPRQKQMKKVQVVYYLSRGGQLEHPHFMEVVLPCNQELRLRDVMDRLTILRGKGMPSLYSWSCKRNYKTGYVWNDLFDDDVIWPVDGVEYVLKGSELLQAFPEKSQEGRMASNAKHATEAPPTGLHFQERTVSMPKSPVPKRRIKVESSVEIPEEPPKHPITRNVSILKTKVIPREDDIGNISTRSEPPHYRQRAEEKSQKSCIIVNREYKGFKSESMHSTVGHGANADKGTPAQEDEEEEEVSKESECTQNSTELSGGEESPQSSSFASFTEAHDESHQTKESTKSVRFEEPNICQSSTRFSLLSFISCGALAVEDDNILNINPLKPVRLAGASQERVSVNSSNKKQFHSKEVEQLDSMAEHQLAGNVQRAEREYFSGSIVEMKGHVEAEEEAEADPTLTKSSSYNAERGSKSEMGGMIENKGDHSSGGKIKCIPRIKCSTKEAMKTPPKELLCDRNKRFP